MLVLVVVCRYNMTRFATWLNELTPPGLEKKLAPTDCRLRPDQHFLEEGVYDQVRRLSVALPSCPTTLKLLSLVFCAALLCITACALGNWPKERTCLCFTSCLQDVAKRSCWLDGYG